jgi:uncharacterized protein (DUF2062 family)
MLFRRRQEQGFFERLRLWLWPRVSWRRSALYFAKRILRLSGTPHAIAMGAAIGIFATITPFLGFHLAITFLVAWLLGANMIAGALATSIGNPLTFPLIWASTYQVGDLILRGVHRAPPERLEHELLHRPVSEILPLIEPMIVGSIPLGLALGAIVYVIVFKSVSAYQEARRRRLEGRRNGGAPAMMGGNP